MDMKEHIYSDDPKVGHADVRTRLAGVDYFFIGNGFLQAAVQVCRSGEGTPLGLLIMHPEQFGPKRAALTCNPDHGLGGTVIELRVGDAVHVPAAAGLNTTWDAVDGVPSVRVFWHSGNLEIIEHFYCPGRSSRRIYRRIRINSNHSDDTDVLLSPGQYGQDDLAISVSSNGSASATLIYEIVSDDGKPAVVSRWKQDDHPSVDAVSYWEGLNRCTTGDSGMDHLFATARSQLPTAVDAVGRMDASIWQYNLEWVRDQVHVAEALIRLGDYGLARTMLARMLDEFVSSEGDVIDSGRRRDPIEVELDQNGELLTALKTYVDWTGDLDLIRDHWSTVEALVSFPLLDEFRHNESGLLHNQRDFWERHSGHGIQDGCELMHQFFVAMGLENAVYLSQVTGCPANLDVWSRAATELRHAFLENTNYHLVEDNHLIKRRGVDGVWQQAISPSAECVLPPSIPLMEDGPRPLEPDTASVLPIVYAFIDPRGELATNTLAQMEELWNQRWESGGYGRYNAGSEPDSPGAWPFASIYIARAFVEAGDDSKVWRILRWLAGTPGSIAGSWFEFFGDRLAPPYAQVGIIPWTWAELISLYIHHLLGVRPDLEGLTLRPYLLEGLDSMDATVLVHGHQIKLDIRRAASDAERRAEIGAESFEWQENGVRLPLPESELTIRVFC